jgi:uncharacterized protein (TIGR00369 family)
MKPPYQQIADNFRRHVPHASDLGIRIEEVGRSIARVALDFREELLGDPERGLIHTGVITSMIDSACGIAVIAALEQPVTVATLDLRMDYLRPALRDRTTHVLAECYRLTRHIAFVRAQAWQDSQDRLVATSTSAFMVQPRRPRPAGGTAS